MCDLFSLPIPTFLPLLPCITNWLEAVEDATRRFGSCPALRDKINCDASGRKRPQILVEETDPAFLHGFSPLEKNKKRRRPTYHRPRSNSSFFSIRPCYSCSQLDGGDSTGCRKRIAIGSWAFLPFACPCTSPCTRSTVGGEEREESLGRLTALLLRITSGRMSSSPGASDTCSSQKDVTWRVGCRVEA